MKGLVSGFFYGLIGVGINWHPQPESMGVVVLIAYVGLGIVLFVSAVEDLI